MSPKAISQRSIRIKALLSLGLVAGLGAVSTMAAWTSTATATAPLGAATVALDVGADATANTAAYTVPIVGTNWFPGMSQAAVVVIKNAGTVAVPYSLAGTIVESGAGTLGANMLSTVAVGSGVSATNAATTGSCGVTGGDTQLATSGSFARNYVTTAAPRTLAAGASEKYCITYSLPSAAASTLQGNTTTLTLTFTASLGQ